jgi:hypothetical protein
MHLARPSINVGSEDTGDRILADEFIHAGRPGSAEALAVPSAAATQAGSHLSVHTRSPYSESPAVSPRNLQVRPAASSISSPPSNFGNVLMSPRKVASNISTFKLANFVLGYAHSPCLAKHDAAYQLALDNTSQIISVAASEKDSSNVSGVLHYARHLAAVHSITHDFTDPKRLTIMFRDSTQTKGIGVIMIKVYAMTLSEARMITELLQIIIDGYAEKYPEPAAAPVGANAITHLEREIADIDIIYIGRVLKRGKMSWAPRWLVLKKFHLRVYKNSKLHVPSNNISLSGAKITTTEEKDKHLTIICMDRSYTFKFADMIERDNVLSLFQKAMELRQRADGSIALSSIGGSAPLPAERSLHASFSMAMPSHDGVGGPAELQRASSYQGPSGSDGTDTDSRKLGQRRPTVRDDWGTWSANAGSPGGIPSTPVGGVIHHPPRVSIVSADSARDNDVVSELPMSAIKRRKSRRTISRDFQSILSKPTHALAIDDVAAVSSHTSAAAKKIEFAEFDIHSFSNVRPISKYVNPGVYTFMQLLAESMTSGAHLSSTLYVPKTVWYQNGAKFQAFSAKLDVLETVRLQMLTVLPPKSADSPDEVERAFSLFRVVAEEAQDKLAQHLSFIHTVKEPFRLRQKSAATTGDHASSSQSGGGAASSLSSSSSFASSSSSFPASSGPRPSSSSVVLQKDATTSGKSLGDKITAKMKTFGKIVTRAASSTKDKVDHEDSARYVRLLHAICAHSEVFREWSAHFASEASNDMHNKAILEEHLAKISDFFYCVLCNVVVRDLKSVLKRYAKHCQRTLIAH